MRLFGQKRKNAPDISVASESTPRQVNNSVSKREPLLLDSDSGSVIIEKIQTALKTQQLEVENSYSSDDVPLTPSWGEKVGPISMVDEWGTNLEPESRDPDPELGAIVLRHGDNARTGPPSPINADFARGGEIHSSLTRESAKAFQPAHSQKLVPLSRSSSPESEEDLARMQQGPLPNPEPLVIAQLIQWKFAAEEGSVTLRIPAVLGSIFLMLSTVLPYLFLASFFTAGHMILSIFVVSHGLLICIIDGRSNFTRDPLGSRAKFRNFATRHLNVLRMVWGRGILYVLVGIVNMAHELYICYISGSIMVLIGLIAMFTGVRAYRNLLTLRRALTDENFLWLEFIKHDVGHHGYLNPSEFAQFISDLGLEFDDLYTLKAFNTIDSNHDQRVTFREFELWWSQVRLNNDVLIL